MMDGEQSWTKNFYKVFSSREKKLLAELFGPGYPTKDLSAKSVNKMIFKFQPSVVEKMKVSPLMPHLLNYYVLTESEKIELADDTISDSQKAVYLLECLSYKGSYAVGALYLSLLDSSYEAYGPPTHYQLACELKRIIQEECTSVSLTLSDALQSHDESRKNLEQQVEGLMDIVVTDAQGRELCNELGTEYTTTVSQVKLNSICMAWIERKGTWAQLTDLVGGLLLVRGLGRYTVNLTVPSYPNLKPFLEGLKTDWTYVARYIGFADSEVGMIVSSHSTVSAQLSQFLKLWRVPDCGQRTTVFLQKLKTVAGVQEARSLSLKKGGRNGEGALGGSLDAAITGGRVTKISHKKPTVDANSSQSLKLNTTRSTPSTLNDTTGTTTTHPQGDKMFVETDSSHDSSSPSSEEGDKIPVVTLNNLEDSSRYHVENGRCSDESEATPKRKHSPRKAHHHHQSPDYNVTRQTITTTVNILENDLESSVTGKPESMETNNSSRKKDDFETEEEQAKDRRLTRKQEDANNLNKSSDEDQHRIVKERDESLFDGSVDSASKGLLDSRLTELVVTSEHSMSREETSEAVEPALQVPPQHFNLSNPVDADLIVVRSPAYLRLEKSQSNENLEVVPCSNSDVEEMVASSLNDFQREREQYNCLSGSSTDDDQSGNTNNFPPVTITPSVEVSSDTHSSMGSSSVVQSLVVKEGSSEDEPNQWIDLSQLGEHPFHDAIETTGNMKQLKALLNHHNLNPGIKRESDGMTALHVACWKGNVEAVELLITRVKNINAKDKERNHCLHYRKALCSRVIVSTLLHHDASFDPPNAKFYTPLTIACEIGDAILETVQLFLVCGASVDGLPKCHTTPLCLACERGHEAVVSLLLSVGPDVNRRDTQTGETPLMKACFNVHVGIVKLLLDSKADPTLSNNEDQTALTVAIVKGSFETAQLLLESCDIVADINSTRSCLDERSGRNYIITPICDAFVRGDLRMTKYLISKGANINTTDRENRAPVKDTGTIAPLVFACSANQVTIVEYVVNLKHFNTTLAFVAEPILEALKRGNDQCAMILCERYGGMEKIKKDASKEHLLELSRLLSYSSKSTTATSTVPATSAGSLSGAISTTVEPLTTTPAASVGDDNDTNTWSQESPVPPTPSAQSTIDVSSHSTAADPLKSTETMTLPLDVHGKSRYNSGGSDDSNELTFTQEDYEPQMTSQLSSEQLNQLDIDEEPVIRASDAKIEEEQSQHVESTNDLSALSEPTHNAQVNPPTADNVLTPLTADNVPTDEENPFTAYPKPPVLSAAESDGETMLGATAAAAPFQQLGSETHSLQGLAVEVLYDFMQYLISACVERNTSEELMIKAEAVDTNLLHFFTRYFFEGSGNRQIVLEFLQGSPSPMDFLLGGGYCSKHDFCTVLKNVGREDFSEQLMLALHQFPNSDSLPWSGPALLDSLFRHSVHVQVGSHPPVPSTPAATPPTLPPLPQSVTSVDYQFPELGGHRLGYSDRLPGSETPSVMDRQQHTHPVAPTIPPVTVQRDSSMNQLSVPKNSTDVDFSRNPPSRGGHVTHSGPVYSTKEDSSLSTLTLDQSPSSLPTTSTVGNEAGSVFTSKATPSVQHLPPPGQHQQSAPLATPIPRKYSTVTSANVSGNYDIVKPILYSASSDEDDLLFQSKEDVSHKPLAAVPFEVKTSTESEDELLVATMRAEPIKTNSHKQVLLSTESDEEISTVSHTTRDTDPVTKPLTSTRGGVAATVGKSMQSKYTIQRTNHSTQVPTKSGSSPVTKRVSKIPKPVYRTPTKPDTHPPTLIKQPVKSDSRTIKPSTYSTPQRIPLSTQKTITRSTSGIHNKPVQRTHTLLSPAGSTSSLSSTSPIITRRKASPLGRNTASRLTTTQASKTDSDKIKKVPEAGSNKIAVKTDAKVSKNVSEQSEELVHSVTKGPTELVFDKNSVLCNPEALFNALSRSIANWKMLGRYLLIPDEEIDGIAKMEITIELKAKQVLNLWCYQTLKCGSEIRYKTLSNALYNSLNDRLIPKLMDHHLNNLTQPTRPSPALTVDLKGLPITASLDSIKPIIDSNLSKGYTHVSVFLEFK